MMNGAAPPMTSSSTAEPLELRIIGMTCGACVSRVERALLEAPGAREVRVQLMTESARVRLDPGAGRPEQLLAAIRAAGYDGEIVPGRAELLAADADDPRRRETLRRHRQAMILAIGLALPILGLGYLGHALQATHAAGHFGWHLLQGCLSALLLVGPAGGPVLASGARALWRRSPNMDLLISMGVSTAFVSSAVGTFALRPEFIHFHAIAMILALVAIGRYLEARAKGRAASAIAAIARRQPQTAMVRRDGRIESIAVDRVAIGDEVVVAPHQALPTDGVVLEGEAAIDESLMTGESVPRRRRPGDSVLAGTLVTDGTLTIRATRLGRDSAVGKILRLVSDAQAGHTPLQRLADRVAAVFTPIVIGVAALVFAGWLMAFGRPGLAQALSAAIAVLVVACPCAMGLATPTVVLVASGLAALRGILVRDAAALETAGRVDTIVWDKTGTLTAGRPNVAEVVALPGESCTQHDVLRLAAAAELFATHPIARAVQEAARREGIPLVEPDAFESVPGRGVAATVDGKSVLVGSAAFLAERGADVAPLRGLAANDTPDTLAVVAVDARAVGVLRIRDEVRPSSAAAIRDLAGRGIRSIILTGDSEQTGRAVAKLLHIDEFMATASPADKTAYVRQLRTRGRRVAMVGDGVNDAAALAAADVGIAFATGADVATAAAGINLIGSTPQLVVDAVRLARASARIIRQNLFWAFAYNVVMIPMAALGVLPPWIAAGAMMASSLTVVANALRLPRFVGWTTPTA